MQNINLNSEITPQSIEKILKKKPHAKHDMILEIIADWGISSETKKQFKHPLCYLVDELINGPEDYDFNFRNLTTFILKYLS